MRSRPWHGMPDAFESADYPATHVSWNDATDFCQRLSESEGKEYRLPTSAEWEYACRAGTTTRFFCGDDEEGLHRVANVADASLEDATGVFWGLSSSDEFAFLAPVGSFQPNAFGLYDMHGNVMEWCQDWCDTKYYETSPTDDPMGPTRSFALRVIRGGDWNSEPGQCRSASRLGFPPAVTLYGVGFRAALVQPE